ARLPSLLALLHPVAELLEQAPVRLVPVRALPAHSLEEERGELAFARPEPRESHVPVRLPLLGRMDDPVGLVEALGRACPDVRTGLLVLVEAGDVRGLEVDVRL